MYKKLGTVQLKKFIFWNTLKDFFQTAIRIETTQGMIRINATELYHISCLLVQN